MIICCMCFRLVYVTEQEWQILKTFYSADGEITVNKEMVTNPRKYTKSVLICLIFV